jgi:hypothetical protein
MGKLHLNLLRLFGLIVTAVSLYLWSKGSPTATVDYHGITVALPVYVLFFLLGVIFFIFPILPLTVFVALAPDSLTGWARRTIEEYTLPNSGLQSAHAQDVLANKLDEFIKHSNRRFWVTIISIILFITLIAPYLVTVQIARSSFRTHSNNLLHSLSDTRFDVSSADYFHRQLQDAAPALESFGPTSTNEVYQILNQLYSPSVTSASEFEKRLTSVYDAKIRPYVLDDIGIIDLDRLPLPYEPSLESSYAKVTLLTLLANICNEQGNQGRYLDPYLQARQLLKAALAINTKDPHDTAYTHNVFGVNYADSLRCYSLYSEKLKLNSVGTGKIKEALGETQPLAPLSMVRLADDHYRKAAAASSNNFAKARYLNNSADLRIWLLRQIHLQGAKIYGDGTTDEQFLIQNVDPPAPGDSSWHPTRLSSILQALANDLGEAIDLAHAPRIYFTRAQLYALAGDLYGRYKFVNVPPWSEAQNLRALGVQDLQTAASLGLPARFLETSRSDEFGLSSLSKSGDPKSTAVGVPGKP